MESNEDGESWVEEQWEKWYGRYVQAHLRPLLFSEARDTRSVCCGEGVIGACFDGGSKGFESKGLEMNTSA